MINTLGPRTLLNLYLVLCSVVLVPAHPSAAQSGVCDPVIEKLSSGTLPYKFIGPQCEGTYSNPTGAKSDLQLVALTQGVLRADFREESALNFEWAPPPASDVRLRATSTRYKYYYQMDAHAGRSVTFSWNTSLLRKTDLGTPELGLLAWTDSTVLGNPETVYLPMKIRTGAVPATSTQPLVVTIVPSVELDEVYKRITHVRPGAPGDKASSGSSLKLGYYPAHKAISIPIDPGTGTGFFRVDFSATPHDGGSLFRSFLVYVAP
jgi:hypothetical protein